MATTKNEDMQLKAVGRSVQGGKSRNADYICCRTFSGKSFFDGVYGLASGSMCEEGDRASEIAVESFNRAIDNISGRAATDAALALDSCVRSVHESLLEQNRGAGEAPLAASFVFGILDGDNIHIAHAGGGAVYSITPEKVSRLTSKVSAGDIDLSDEEALSLLEPGMIPAGMKGFNSIQLSSPVFEKDGTETQFLFCSEALMKRLDSITIQKILGDAATLEEGVDKLLQEAHKKDASADVSAVVVDLKGEDAIPPEERFPQKIEYPVTLRMRKVAVVFILVAFSWLAISFNQSIAGFAGIEVAEPENEGIQVAVALADKVADNIKNKTQGRSAAKEQLSTIAVRTEPEGAKIFIDGLEAEKSPAEVVVEPGREIELRIEADGFEPYIEKLAVDKDLKIERIITLATLKPDNGSLIVRCNPNCASLTLDGHGISGFPKEQITMHELQPGAHIIEAAFEGKSETREITVGSGESQSVIFNFSQGGRSLARTGAASGNTSSEVEVVEPANSGAGSRENIVSHTRPVAHETNTVVIDERKPAKILRSFFTVKTNVEDCNIMVLKNGALVTTGFSGARMDVEPGRYTIVASKPGFEEQELDVVLEDDYQVININLIR